MISDEQLNNILADIKLFAVNNEITKSCGEKLSVDYSINH